MDPPEGISPYARRRSIMVRMDLLQSVGSRYFHIQINSDDPHFVGLNEVLARIPFRDPEVRRFVELHNPSPLPIVVIITGEEGEGDFGADEPITLSTDEEYSD